MREADGAPGKAASVHGAADISRMVRRQIASRGVGDLRVLAAMRKVERAAFLPESMREFAYQDTALPLDCGQTISQPYIVARMAEIAAIKPADHVLEIGAGSGYAAAVFAEMAAHVCTIERHAALADYARSRLQAMGYDNVEVRAGDGTRGWPEAAPFDVIIVSAGGPRVPDTLRHQLSVGGRLVMPVGTTAGRQRLVRLVRTTQHDFDEEWLDDVRFVPLIGAEGWSAEAPEPPPDIRLPHLIGAASRPLPPPEHAAFADPFERFADKRVVLLGEASHGTAEFYRARAAITRRLVERHGFNIVAVEADWPDASALDGYVRHREPVKGATIFRRFPTWMWRNSEVDGFLRWLRAHNAGLDEARRAGFHGLDVYSLSESIAAVLAYLDRTDPETARVARERYGCLTPWQQDPASYGRAVLGRRYRECEKDVVAMLTDLLAKRLSAGGDRDRLFDAVQNAELVAAAERYYRIMYYGSAESWNVRDRHMFDTLERLLDHRGASSKAVVWAHNSHIGDARFTDMGRVRDELNLGQLCRERFGDAMAAIGFGTDRGTVAAAHDWDGPMEIMDVRPSRPGSIERQFHDSGIGCGVLMMGEAREALRAELGEQRLERFIGVIYRPDTELQSHYAGVELARQFDAYVWFDQTSAITPLPGQKNASEPADTWPFGV